MRESVKQSIRQGIKRSIRGPASQFVLLDGVSGSYASTPDSVGSSITADLTIIAWISFQDWTPSDQKGIVTKWNSAGNQRSYLFGKDQGSTGDLEFITSTTGADAITSNSTVAAPFANNQGGWVRVTYDDTANEVKFYTSGESVHSNISAINWTQLGATVSHVGSGIYDGTAATVVGGWNAGTAGNALGRFSRLHIIASTDPDAAAAVEFDPNEYASGSTWTSSTGEVWTIAGNARIVAQ